MNKKLILISALLFIVGCEREITFVCEVPPFPDAVKVIMSSDKTHIEVITNEDQMAHTFWKRQTYPDSNGFAGGEVLYIRSTTTFSTRPSDPRNYLFWYDPVKKSFKAGLSIRGRKDCSRL